MDTFRDRALERMRGLGFALFVGVIWVLLPTWGTSAAEPIELIGSHRLIDLSVTVTFNDGVEEQTVTATERITVRRIVGVEVVNPADQDYEWRYIHPSASTDFNVTVKNTGNDRDTFVIQFEGVPQGWQAELLHADGTPLTGDLVLDRGTSEDLIVRLTAPPRRSSGGNGVSEGDQAHVRLRVASWAGQQSWYHGPGHAREAITGAMHVQVVDAELALRVGDDIVTDPSDHQNDVYVTFNASLTNHGTGQVKNLVWLHPVPEPLDLHTVSIEVAGGTECTAYVDGVNRNVVVQCGSVAPGQTVALSFDVQVPQHTPPGALSTPLMTVTYEDTIGNSFTIQENIQRVTVNTYHMVSIHVLGIKINDGEMTTDYTATRGDEVTLVAFVRNEGNVRDSYDVALANTHGSIIWLPQQQSAPHVDPGAGVTVEFKTALSSEVADGDQDVITLTVAVPAGGSNLTAQTSVTLLIATPVVRVSLTASNENPFPGEAVVLTLTIENTGGYAAEWLRVEAPIPAGTTYQAGSLSVNRPGWDISEDERMLVVGPGVLAAGDTLIVMYTVTID